MATDKALVFAVCAPTLAGCGGLIGPFADGALYD